MKRRCRECRLHLWYCPHCRGEYCYMVFCGLNTYETHRQACPWFRHRSKTDEPLYQARAGRMMGGGDSTAYRGPKFG